MVSPLTEHEFVFTLQASIFLKGEALPSQEDLEQAASDLLKSGGFNIERLRMLKVFRVLTPSEVATKTTHQDLVQIVEEGQALQSEIEGLNQLRDLLTVQIRVLRYQHSKRKITADAAKNQLDQAATEGRQALGGKGLPATLEEGA